MTRTLREAERAIAAHIVDCSICKGSVKVEVGSEFGFQIHGFCKSGWALVPEWISLEPIEKKGGKKI